MSSPSYMSINGEKSTALNPLLPAVDEEVAMCGPREGALPSRISAQEIESIANWRPRRPRAKAASHDEARANLAARRLRAGGDVSLEENDYRDGYRSWRLGRSSGAVTTSSGAAG